MAMVESDRPSSRGKMWVLMMSEGISARVVAAIVTFRVGEDG